MVFELIHHTLAIMGGHNLAHTQVLEDHHLLTFGGTQIDNQNAGENWVRDSEASHAEPGMDDAPDDQGMYNNYAAILTPWWDTTEYDNIRGPAKSHDGLPVAGGKEYMTLGHSFHPSTSTTGSAHPLEDAEASAPAPVEVQDGQSNAAGRTVGVAPKSTLYLTTAR